MTQKGFSQNFEENTYTRHHGRVHLTNPNIDSLYVLANLGFMTINSQSRQLNVLYTMCNFELKMTFFYYPNAKIRNLYKHGSKEYVYIDSVVAYLGPLGHHMEEMMYGFFVIFIEPNISKFLITFPFKYTFITCVKYHM